MLTHLQNSNLEILPYRQCPSFVSCSTPKCSLDPEIALRNRYSGEEKCKAHKPTRFKIGSKFPELLPYQGLTKREWDGKKLSENIAEVERVKKREFSVSRLLRTQNPPKKGIVVRVDDPKFQTERLNGSLIA